MTQSHDASIDDMNLGGNDQTFIDPLHHLDSMQDFIKRLDWNFEQHMKSLGQFHHLLELKGKIDQDYAKSLDMLSLRFSDLSKIAVNDRIKDLVLALGRNFKNVATNLETMSFDLLSEAGKGFDKCKEETTNQLSQIKQFLKGTYY
jgi:hypothetical protein